MNTHTYISAYNLEHITHIYFMADIRTVCINMVQYPHICRGSSSYVCVCPSRYTGSHTSGVHCAHMKNHYALIRFVQRYTSELGTPLGVYTAPCGWDSKQRPH